MNTYYVTPFFNRDPFDEYRNMSILDMSKHFTQALALEAENAMDAAQSAFDYLNYDGRPNGQVERSLSVGDVLHITTEREGKGTFYAVAGHGFTMIPEPPIIAIDELVEA